jgi:hypothetical protein
MLWPPSLQTAKMKFAFRGLLWFHATVMMMCLFLGLCFLDCPLLALNLPRKLVTVAYALLSIVIMMLSMYFFLFFFVFVQFMPVDHQRACYSHAQKTNKAK